MADSNNVYPTPIPAQRCTQCGTAGIDAMDWALRISMALLALAAIWLLIVVVKPLPTGMAQVPPSIPMIKPISNPVATIDERQQRLALLSTSGNMYAPDRRNWIVRAASTPSSENTGLTADRMSAPQPTQIADTGSPIDSIVLTEDAPVAIKKRLDLLKLRGVYVAEGDPVAMIGERSNTRSERYRVGDSLNGGEWELVAIDEARDRVILNRSGLNFELNLYETGSSARVNAVPRSTISATNGTGDPDIGFTSLDKVASELRDAGLPRDQINDLISLAQDDPDLDAEAIKPEAENKPEQKKTAVPPAMPPGMVQLFRAMADGSREVIAPPAVEKPTEESNTDDEEADQPAEKDSANDEEQDK